MSIFIFESEFLFYKILDCRFECFKTHLFQCKCLHLSRPIRNCTVPLPDKTSISVHSYGDIKLNDHIILKDVLFVPQFQVNLLSVSALTTTSLLTINCFPNHFLIQVFNIMRTIGMVESCQDLHILDSDKLSMLHMEDSFQSKSFSASVNKVSTKVWHQRLGHLSNKIFVLLKDWFPKWNDNNPSYICPLAKQNYLFLFPTTFWPNILLIWFIVTYGALIMFLHTHKYFLNIMDDYTRFTWVFLLKWKCDATLIISYFFNMVATQFNSIIKCLRSDNAKELTLTEFLNEKRVIHQFSCVDRPQQSVVEWKHQHLLNIARALYFQSRIPIKFWTDCRLTATFLINRTPSPLHKNKSPFKLLYNTTSDYSSFKVFGCLAFASTLPTNRAKFDLEPEYVFFLAILIMSKTTSCMTSRINNFISSDVIFHEELFPFHSIIPQESVVPFPQVVLRVSADDVPVNPPVILATDNPTHSNPQPPQSVLPIPNLLELLNLLLSFVISIVIISINNLFLVLLIPIFHILYLNTYHIIPYPHLIIMVILSNYKPQFYHLAISFQHWRDAMQTELEATKCNKYLVYYYFTPREVSYLLQMGLQDQIQFRWLIERYKAD